MWCASYPKSGNTWVRALLTSLSTAAAPDLNRLDGGAVGATHLRERLGVGVSGVSEAEAAKLQRLALTLDTAPAGGFIPRKTHEAWLPGPDGIPRCWQPPGARVLYVVRDPRAVAVSWAYHLGLPLAHAVAMMADDGVEIRKPHDPLTGFTPGSWSGHVTSWLDQDDLPVLLIRYEDLLDQPLPEVTRVAGWAGLPTDPDRVAAAVEACSFTNLAVAEIVGGFAERSAADRPFFRRGEAAAWRDELSPALAEQIVARHGRVMARFGYLD